MSPSIRISETTKYLLDLAKEKMGTKSYDETIRKILEKQLRIPKSMFGSFKGKMKPFTKSDRLKLSE